MAWSTKTCLNRWCPRTLHEDNESAPRDCRSEAASIALFSQIRHPVGRPLMENCCIAPYCDHWQGIDEEHGFCDYRQALSRALLQQYHRRR